MDRIYLFYEFWVKIVNAFDTMPFRGKKRAAFVQTEWLSKEKPFEMSTLLSIEIPLWNVDFLKAHTHK